ncbi:MAG: YqgE/AlgH family protein [Acetobacteraceae bacterium]|nr:YqgE/AlgH family protein [Acetobacteraceae bacterium]MBV8577912.1 YqgE/AlgH family protein [Acetobacteraceae bacterium]
MAKRPPARPVSSQSDELSEPPGGEGAGSNRSPRVGPPRSRNSSLADEPRKRGKRSAQAGPLSSAKSQRPTHPSETDHFLTGQMLVAMPAMADPRFTQSVIYVCAHTDDGAMGIVVNRPIERPSFDDLLRQLEVEPVPPARRIRLCAGGPVDNARGFVLHTADWTGDGSLRVTDNLALTASLDVLKAIAEGGGPRAGILALGYAGWGPGQLDAEMTQNAWLSVSPDERILFDDDHSTKWRRALAKLKIDPLLLSGNAGHA